MKILIVSNSPHAPTGYGVPIKNLIPHLKKAGHEIAVQAFFGVQGASIEWDGVTIYPNQREAYGIDAIAAHVRDFVPDLVVTLLDNWAFPDDYHQRIGEVRWLQWFPIDGRPAPPRSVAMAKRAEYPAVFSRDSVEQMARAGVDTTYLPYGVDCDTFRLGDKQQARDTLKLPQDRFIAVTVATNKGWPARKSWPELLRGFEMFNREHPHSLLYLHTRIQPVTKAGAYFEPLVQAMDIPRDAIRFANQDDFAIGCANENLITLYQAADVMLLPSMGEGFGLPIVEAQACGTPVITQRCSSMPELTINGICIEPLQPFWVPVLNYWWQLAGVENISLGLEYIYRRDDLQNIEFGNRGIEHIKANYHWPVVFQKHWKPLLERIEEELW